MSHATKYFRAALDFLFIGMLGVLLILLRYISRMSRVLQSVLPGEEHFYIWSYNSTQYKIYYKVSGPIDGPSLVLFHTPGIGASAYEMRHIMPELAQNCRVYVPDLLGFGLSDHPDIKYTPALYIALYTDFLQSVVKRPTVVVASGLSCNYSVVVAQRSPALCARLVLLSPLTLFEDPRPSPWLAPLLNASGSGLIVYAALTLPFILRMVIAQQHQQPFRQVPADELDYTLTSATQAGSHYAVLALLHEALQMNVATQFELLTQPVLFIQGTRPPLLSGTVQPPLLAQSIAQSEQITVVPFTDSGVRIHEEHPAQVISSITRWQNEPSIEQTNAPVSLAEASTQPPAESTEIAFDSSNIVALNIVDTVSESSVGEVAQDVALPDPAEVNVMQESTAERETEQELEVLLERTEAYCVKCREKREMQNARRIVTKNGRNAMEGTCPVCSTRLFRFIAR